MGTGRPRVLLVEDDEPLREGVAATLRSRGYDVRAIDHGAELDAEVSTFEPDVAVLDVGLVDGPDGFALGAELAARNDGPPFVFLTAAGAIEERLRGFDLGADDYIVKPFSTRELDSRLRVVLRRSGQAPEAMAEGPDDVVIDEVNRTVHRAGSEVRLTPTEFDLLSTLASSPGEVWSKRDLVRDVWGTEHYTPHVVEVYISSLRKKLEQHGPRIVLTHREGGYSLRP